MRIRNLIVAVFCLALAVPGIASAQRPAESGFKVTGGGQIIAEDAENGPGDTVGFNAQDMDQESDLARGQFQYVPRGQSTNESAFDEKFHGVVTCLISGGEAMAEEAGAGEDSDNLALGMARFGGYLRDDPGTFFTVDVTDNGQGGNAEGDDMILVRMTEEPCADNPEEEDGTAEDQLRLGRGNVKIHNNPDDAETMAAAAAAFALK